MKRCLLQIGVFVFVVCCVTETLTSNEAFRRASIIYGVATLANEQHRNNNSASVCIKELAEFYDAANSQKVWGLKMMDVSGRPPQGFFWGDNAWLGSSELCLDLTNRKLTEVYRAKVVELATEYDFPPYEVNYVHVYMRHDNSVQLKTNADLQNLITLGLCVPLSCTPNEVKPLVEKTLNQKALTFQKMHDMNLKIVGIKFLELDFAWLTTSTTNTFILYTLLAIMGFMWYATRYDLKYYDNKPIEHHGLRNGHSNGHANGTTANGQGPPAPTIENKTNEEKADDMIAEIAMVKSFKDRMLLCFSLNRTHKLLLTSEVPSTVKAMNGLMTFAFVHMMVYQFMIHSTYYLKDKAMEYKKMESFLGQFISNSSFAADTILFLSGCLLSYKFYQTSNDFLCKTGFFPKLYETIKMIVQRIFRVVPFYAISIMLGYFSFSYLNARWPAFIPERVDLACAESWWRNLLFINNLPSPGEQKCMSWTWLIAADMQYYIAGTLLLVLSTISMPISVATIIGAILYGEYSTALTAYKIGYVHTIDQQMAEIESLFQWPLHRFGPYAIGLLTGLILIRLNGKLPLKKTTIRLLWVSTTIMNLYLIFGLYGQRPSVEFSSIYIALSRTAWAVGIAWILIACSTGNGGLLETVLCHNGFKMFHRQALLAYILAPVHMYLMNVTHDAQFLYSTLAYISQIFANALYSICFNCVLTLFYAFPYELIIKTVNKKVKQL